MPINGKDINQRRGNANERRWTQSMITGYLRCPRYFELTYILNQPSMYSAALVEGITHHDALDTDNVSKYKHNKPLSEKQHYECFADYFTKDKNKIETWEGENEKIVMNRGKSIVKNYKHANVSKLVPVKIGEYVGTELYFEFNFNLDKYDKRIYTMQGFIDLLTKNEWNRLKLLDYKVTKRARTQASVVDSFQLSLYTIAVMKIASCGVTNISSGITSLVKNGNIDVKMCMRSIDQINWTMRVAKGVIRATETGIFPVCSPEHYLCNPNYCGQWYRCRGKKTKITVPT